MSKLLLHNSTHVPTVDLADLFEAIVSAWAVGTVTVRVRYSRGADFSGTCYYAGRRIYINLGRHLKYPYAMGTHLARAKTVGRAWYKPLYRIRLTDDRQVVLFVFLHEIYHLLVKLARRNTRQKESMCDRFAARYLVDRFGVEVVDEKKKPVPRDVWDFQDLDGFVAAAHDRRRAAPTKPPRAPKPNPKPAPKPAPTTTTQRAAIGRAATEPARPDAAQLMLFPI